MFYKFTVFFVETEEIRSCTSLKVLYNSIRSELRYYQRQGKHLTAKVYIDLAGWEFDTAQPYMIMEV